MTSSKIIKTEPLSKKGALVQTTFANAGFNTVDYSVYEEPNPLSTTAKAVTAENLHMLDRKSLNNDGTHQCLAAIELRPGSSGGQHDCELVLHFNHQQDASHGGALRRSATGLLALAGINGAMSNVDENNSRLIYQHVNLTTLAQAAKALATAPTIKRGPMGTVRPLMTEAIANNIIRMEEERLNLKLGIPTFDVTRDLLSPKTIFSTRFTSAVDQDSPIGAIDEVTPQDGLPSLVVHGHVGRDQNEILGMAPKGYIGTPDGRNRIVFQVPQGSTYHLSLEDAAQDLIEKLRTRGIVKGEGERVKQQDGPRPWAGKLTTASAGALPPHG